MGEEQRTPCAWCGKRIVRGYHGDSKSLFMKRYRFYCSKKCKEADSLPDWACFPAILIPAEAGLTFWWFTENLFVTNLLGTLFSVGLLSLVTIGSIWIVKGILNLRKEIPKDSMLD